jgi:hypothetical protein
LRRAVGDDWPALSRVYGIHPWDVHRLTFHEIATYQADLAEQRWHNRPR